MRAFLVFLLLVFCEFSFAQKNYNVNSINGGLLQNANTVVRKNITEFEIISSSQAVLKVDFAVTILNAAGDDAAHLVAYYDEFRTITSMEGAVYNKEGKEVRKLKRDDIRDQSIIAGFAFYDDNRVKHAVADYKDYPYTFEYSYKVKYNGMNSYPSWYPYSAYNQSLERAQFTVICPEEMSFRYSEKNNVKNALITEDKGKKSYTWSMTNLYALEKENFSGGLQSNTPQVLLAPNEINMDGNFSRNETWDDFANWISNLNAERGELPLETQNEIKIITSKASNDKEKVRILYDYLQNKTRYVSIQLGIGGWQPFEAKTVDELGYGDCKALSNYMKSMLDLVGIRSNYVLVAAGPDRPNIHKDFPGNQFNHAFVMVPLESDTIWLECTNQNVPFGYIGSFTDDRDVLVIEEGGKSSIVRTPAYSQGENRQVREGVVNIEKDGTSYAQFKTEYSGAKYSEVLPLLLYGNDKAKNYLYQTIDLQNFSIESVNYEEKVEGEITQSLKLEVSGYAQKSGNNLIIPLHFIPSGFVDLKRKKDRYGDIVIRRSFSDIEKVTYKLPPGYFAANKPKSLEIKSEFGEYQISIELEDKFIIYQRKLSMNKGKYPSSKIDEFDEFLKSIKRGDKQKILLKFGT